jgi:hypothetical protein
MITTKLHGKIRETRRGHFQYYFSFNGKRYYLQKTLDGKPLDNLEQANLLQFYISLHINKWDFDPLKLIPLFFHLKG